MKSIGTLLIKRKTLLLTAVVYTVLSSAAPEIVARSLGYLKAFLLEMIQVLPLVLLATALLDEWVPSAVITRHLGPKSGGLGILYSYLLGSISAGPIYAAFPMCHALYRKGASISNVVIILSSWAVIKIPMLFMELRFLGPTFAGLRYITTVPAVLALGIIMGRIRGYAIPADPESASPPADKELMHRLELLPGRNCKACGYESCSELAKSVTDIDKLRSACAFVD